MLLLELLHLHLTFALKHTCLSPAISYLSRSQQNYAMVSGLEFLAMFSHAVQMDSSQANLPSSGIQNTTNRSIESVMEARSSGGIVSANELHHPRPVYKAKFTDAIERFEKVAQSMGDANAASNKEPLSDNSWGQSNFEQRGSAKVRSREEWSTLPLVERIIAPPKKATIQNKPDAVYRSHESLAPPFSFHYSHSMWAPCPEGQWPSFDTANTIRAAGPSARRPLPAVPLPPLPPNSTLAFGSSGSMNDFSDTTVHQPESQPAQDWSLHVPSSLQLALDSFSETPQPEATQATSHSPIIRAIGGNTELQERQSSGGDDTSELEYISEISDEGGDALENAAISFLRLDDDSEARDEADDSEEYYTASEYSEYSEYSEGTNAVGGTVPLASSRLIPSAYRYRSNSSSTSSSASYGYIPSVEWDPSTATGSVNPETRVPSDLTYDICVPSPAWWMKAIPGHKVSFISAVERSKRRHAQAWTCNLRKVSHGATQRTVRC